MTTTEHLPAPANGANDGRRRASAPGLEGSVRARVPADVDAPDRILAGLTSRQVAVLAVAAVAAYLGWDTLHRMVPTSMLVGLAVPVTGVTFALVVGRRDGLALDVWLAHAIRYARTPRRLVPARVPPLAAWAPELPSKQPTVGVLRLPADAIEPDGVIRTGRSTSVAVVAATTVNATESSPTDRAGLVAELRGLAEQSRRRDAGRGLQPASRSSRPRDARARRPPTSSRTPPWPGPRSATRSSYSTWPKRGSRLVRTVTVTTSGTGSDPAIVARRAADQAAAALAGLGSSAEVLDGAAVTALLAGSVDPFAPGDASWPRASIAQPVSGARGGGVLVRTTTSPRPADVPPEGTQAELVDGVQPRGVAGVVGPHSVQVGAHAVRVGDGWAATLIVTGYPASVGLAWLEPVLRLAPAARVTTAIHIDPLPAGSRRGRTAAPDGRGWNPPGGWTPTRAGWSTPPPRSPPATPRTSPTDWPRGAVRAVPGRAVPDRPRAHPRGAAGGGRAGAGRRRVVLLDTQPATWRQLPGGPPRCRWPRRAAAAPGDGHRRPRPGVPPGLSRTCPRRCPADPTRPAASCTGSTRPPAAMVWWDRWTQHNHNGLVLARSGAGKSYLVKLDILRNLYDGVAGRRHRPRGRIPTARRRRRRHHPRPRRSPASGSTRSTCRPATDRPRRPAAPDPVPAHPGRRCCSASPWTPNGSKPSTRAVTRHLRRRRHHQRARHLEPARAAARRPRRHPRAARRCREGGGGAAAPVDARLVQATCSTAPPRSARRGSWSCGPTAAAARRAARRRACCSPWTPSGATSTPPPTGAGS